jgi:hypothetical protein
MHGVLASRELRFSGHCPPNDSLERDIAELLTRPVGRPSHKPAVWYKGFLYQAASWKTARRVVAKVEFHFGELFPRVGFIETNLETPNRAVVRFYNKRGKAGRNSTAILPMYLLSWNGSPTSSMRKPGAVEAEQTRCSFLLLEFRLHPMLIRFVQE